MFLQKSPLGITVDGHDLGKGASLVAEPEIEKIQEKYPIFGESCRSIGERGRGGIADAGFRGAFRLGGASV